MHARSHGINSQALQAAEKPNAFEGYDLQVERDYVTGFAR